VHFVYHFFQHLAFTPQFLAFFAVLPELRIFRKTNDLVQAFDLDIEVKDTSAGPEDAQSGPVEEFPGHSVVPLPWDEISPIKPWIIPREALP
jgi:hypothetical protein